MAVKRFLALDIGASTLKLGEFIVGKDSKPTLVGFGYASLEGKNATNEEHGLSVSDALLVVTDALRKLVVEKNFKSRRIAVSVSGQMVLTRFMKLPATDESKIRQMVHYEAAQNVPFPIEEVVWDYQVVGGKLGGEMDVILVAIKNEIIEGVTSCVEAAGLNVEIVDIAPLAIYNAALYNYDSLKGCTLVLDIGARTTNLIFIEEKKVFTRSISVAGNTITQSIAQEMNISFSEAERLKLDHGFVGLGGAYEEPEDEIAAKLSKVIRNVMTQLHAQVSRSINFYKQQQNGTAPKLLLLSGGTSMTSYTEHFFKEKMEVEVEYFNPFQSIPIKVPPEELEKEAHTMGEVVGLALRLITECPIEINLLPPVIIKRRQFNKKIPFFVASMAGILLILISWWFYHWRMAGLLERHLSDISGEITHLSNIESDLKKVETLAKDAHSQAEQVDHVIQARYFWPEFFEDLNRRIPNDVWIVQFTPESGGKAVPFQISSSTGKTGITPPPTKGAALSMIKPGITDFEIQALCLIKPNLSVSELSKPMEDFRANLFQSPYFEDVKFIGSNPFVSADWTYKFSFRVKLKKPIPY